jgi:sugar O-acyltransferase (sialic acid O-acetyltransferase NeuD family)
MPTDRILIVGAGGHASVVMDALLRSLGGTANAFFVDDDRKLHGRRLLGCEVLGAIDCVTPTDRFHVAIGNNRIRRETAARLEALGATQVAIVHPAAVVSPHATVAAGAFVAAGAIVAPTGRVDAGVIVNHGAIVDHDCVVGAFSHVAPGATLGGNVHLGLEVFVGAGANLLPGVRVGNGVTIGAGAVVLADVGAGETIAGVPARRLRGR